MLSTMFNLVQPLFYTNKVLQVSQNISHTFNFYKVVKDFNGRLYQQLAVPYMFKQDSPTTHFTYFYVGVVRGSSHSAVHSTCVTAQKICLAVKCLVLWRASPKGLWDIFMNVHMYLFMCSVHLWKWKCVI